MAKRRKRNKTELTSLIIVLLVVAISLLFKNASDKKQELETYVAVSDKEAVVHVINVGQGSSALIQCGKNGILIDAGEAEYGSMVANYIKASGVTQLSYVIASHPHSDHIGGLSRVLNSIPVKHVILPYITDENVPATASYERLLETIDRKNIDCTFWEYGDKNVFGIENVTLKILAPVGQTESLNNMSLICRVVAFGTSFLFPGDAENAELKDMMMKSPDSSSDVMITSHIPVCTNSNFRASALP